MKKNFKFVPNLLTSLNLFCGCLSIVFAFENELLTALIFIIIAAIFDFFDGFAARLLDAKSAIGKELDSLSDLVSFGVAPASMLYVASLDVWCLQCFDWIRFTPFLLVIFSSLRLAKFNVDERQTVNFIGLPTPANALFFISFSNLVNEIDVFQNQYIIIAVILFFSALMVSEMQMFSVKKLIESKLKIILVSILVITICVSVYLVDIYAGAVVIPVYILLSGIRGLF